jgi:VanZ family protein
MRQDPRELLLHRFMKIQHVFYFLAIGFVYLAALQKGSGGAMAVAAVFFIAGVIRGKK